MPNRFFLPLVLCAACVAGGCKMSMPLSPYRMEIQQGNFLTQEQVDKLQVGMTREQVRFLLGTPLLTDVFHTDRWDYVYRRQKARSKEVEERRLTVFFANNRLTRTEGDLMPSPQPNAAPQVETPAQPEPSPQADASRQAEPSPPVDAGATP